MRASVTASTNQAIDDRLEILSVQLQRASEQIALLALLAIARCVRKHLPEAAFVGLTWSDKDDCLSPANYYTADGQPIVEKDLDAAIASYCGYLDDLNCFAWQPFTIGDRRLIIDNALAIDTSETEAFKDTPVAEHRLSREEDRRPHEQVASKER